MVGMMLVLVPNALGLAMGSVEKLVAGAHTNCCARLWRKLSALKANQLPVTLQTGSPWLEEVGLRN